jgi:hypothetical protein
LRGRTSKSSASTERDRPLAKLAPPRRHRAPHPVNAAWRSPTHRPWRGPSPIPRCG